MPEATKSNNLRKTEPKPEKKPVVGPVVRKGGCC